MASVTFLGTGDPVEAFNIDDTLVLRPLLPGEVRLYTPFPFFTLEKWRQTALQYTAAPTVTGNSDLGTRARTTLLFAHDADLGSIFFNLVGTNRDLLAGYYVDKMKPQVVDRLIGPQMMYQQQAMQELAAQRVPAQYIELIANRLSGPAFNHRVAGFCASVYLASILLDGNGK